MDLYAKSEKTLSDGCYKLDRHPDTGKLFWRLHYRHQPHDLELDLSQRERIYIVEGGDKFLVGRTFLEEDLGN